MISHLKDELIKFHENLNILKEREARYAGNAPLDLLNQIHDYEMAIDLTERTLQGEISEAEREMALKPLTISQAGNISDFHQNVFGHGSAVTGPGGTAIVNVYQHFSNQPEKPPRPFMVEDLPPDFVHRPEETEALIAFLLHQDEQRPVAITAALHGAGGYGKTTIARAVCHDERVRTCFSDGILWVTLGENPNIVAGVTKIYAQLTDRRPNFVDQEDAANDLATILADRRYLLVIDDVWHQTHLKPFMRGGPRCVRLITTRNSDTLPRDVRRVNVDAMQSSEAIALLSTGLPEATEVKRNIIELAARLGEWPLLLKLVNSVLQKQVNWGASLSDALEYVNKVLDERGLIGFDARNAIEREDAVAKTLAMSLDLLDEDEYRRYWELAIFPEDIDIPLVTVENLWRATGGLNALDTQELCARLYQLSLLLSFDLRSRTIRLHDIIRTYLKHQHKDQLPTVHAYLLNAHYPAECSDLLLKILASSPQSPEWADLSADEPYLWEHLAYHLIEAERSDELIDTVKNLRYLATKAYLRGSLSVENDLSLAEIQASDEATIRLLRRSFANAGHLLKYIESLKDLTATLYSRLQPLKLLANQTQHLADHLPGNILIPRHPLPDLPHPALIRTLTGHSERVLGCAISPDGRKIVSASADHTLKIWDLQTGQELHTLSGHSNWVLSCAISPDGYKIVSASDDLSLKVWDTVNGQELLTLTGHTGRVLGCAISPDGRKAVSASADHTLKVWDMQSGEELLTIVGHTLAGINGCAISPDGRYIVSVSPDRTLKIWDAQNGEELHTLTGHTNWVNGCAVSPDSRHIVSASSDCTLKVWDAQNGEELHTLMGHTDWVTGCTFSPDGDKIISVSYDQSLRVWNNQTGEELHTLIGHTGRILGCVTSPDGRYVVSTSEDETLRIWDIQSGEEHPNIIGHTNLVLDCDISSDGHQVISVSEDYTLKIWDVQNGQTLQTLIGHRGRVLGCAISSDGKQIVSASEDYTLKVWSMQNGQELLPLTGHGGWVNDCAISPDGQLIISASTDGTLKVWDMHSGEERRTLIGHEGLVLACAISPDGQQIVSTSDDHTLKVWDISSGQERLTLSGHEGWVNGCAFSPSGKQIVSASADGTLKIWDAQSGKELYILIGHMNWVNDCAFSPDGRYLVSVSYDRNVKIWDTETGHCLTTLAVDGPLFGCAWSPAGPDVIAVGGGGVYFLQFIDESQKIFE